MRSIYISTLGFLLAMPVQKGLKAWLTCGTCVAHAVPCTITFLFTGILDNSFSLIVFLSSRDLRTKQTNWYLINQSILDMFSSIFVFLFTVTVTASDKSTTLTFGITAELLCRYSCFQSYLKLLSSPNSSS